MSPAPRLRRRPVRGARAPRDRDEQGALRRRTLIVVPVLLGGVAVAGGYGARMMLSEGDSDGAGVVCWNGRAEAGPGDCSALAGRSGLQWAFPSFDPDRLDCTDDLVGDDGRNVRPASWTCQVTVAGRPARVTYYRMADPQQAGAFQERRFGSPAETATARRVVGEGAVAQEVWRGRVGEEFLLVAHRTDVPFAVEVAADTARVRERAFRAVRFRGGELRLRPPAADAGSSSASGTVSG